MLISWESIADRPVGFYSMLLLLETGMLGVFCARDIILFYIFFEFTLIPLFFLIGIWGSEDRRYAAVKFFLFTFAGSVLTFLGLLTIVIWQYLSSPTHELTFSIARLTAALDANPIPNDAAHGYLQLWVFLALVAGFAVKVPLFPVHTWLPLAHTQAPTAGSVLLAGILLKIGTYGFLRFNLPMLPEAAAWCLPIVLLLLAVIGIVYDALLAVGPNRYEAARGLLQRQPHGLCHAGDLRPQFAGLARGRSADDQSRHFDRGVVRSGRDDLRALPHPQNRRLAWTRAALAVAVVLSRVLHVFKHRIARHEWLCRRVLDFTRDVPARLVAVARGSRLALARAGGHRRFGRGAGGAWGTC